jgi:hypothetical protein
MKSPKMVFFDQRISEMINLKRDFFFTVWKFLIKSWKHWPVPECIDPVFAKGSLKRSFSMTENERYGLVFAKTMSINLGTRFRTGNFLFLQRKDSQATWVTALEDKHLLYSSN